MLNVTISVATVTLYMVLNKHMSGYEATIMFYLSLIALNTCDIARLANKIKLLKWRD